MAIFREAFCLSLQDVFEWEKSKITESKLMQTEDQVNQADEYRQLVLITVLLLAALIYHKFRKSRGVNHFDVQSVDELMFDFRIWRSQWL